MSLEPFVAPWLLRNPHVQSILGTSGPRRLLARSRWRNLLSAAQPVLLTCSDGVRLQAHHSAQPHNTRGFVTLIHGWEGSADSLYVLSAAGHLYDRGFDVLRLNLRDHGKTHHLNREPFTSTRLREVLEALKSVGQIYPHDRRFLAGFSLGGNFALRVAARAPHEGIALSRVVAVCPVVLPHRTLDDLEKGWFLYRRYFLFKWKRSLRRKLALHPELGFGPALRRCRTLSEMNRHFVPLFTEFATPLEYCLGYSLAGHTLSELRVPSHILAAADDPVIAAAHFEQLAGSPSLSVEISPHGGHCGFITSLSAASWIDRRLDELLV